MFDTHVRERHDTGLPFGLPFGFESRADVVLTESCRLSHSQGFMLSSAYIRFRDPPRDIRSNARPLRSENSRDLKDSCTVGISFQEDLGARIYGVRDSI